jgi:hypothetical protein
MSESGWLWGAWRNVEVYQNLCNNWKTFVRHGFKPLACSNFSVALTLQAVTFRLPALAGAAVLLVALDPAGRGPPIC